MKLFYVFKLVPYYKSNIIFFKPLYKKVIKINLTVHNVKPSCCTTYTESLKL